MRRMGFWAVLCLSMVPASFTTAGAATITGAGAMHDVPTSTPLIRLTISAAGEPITSATVFIKYRPAAGVRESVLRSIDAPGLTATVIETTNALVLRGPRAAVEAARDTLVPRFDVPQRQFQCEFLVITALTTGTLSPRNEVIRTLLKGEPIDPATVNRWRTRGSIGVQMDPRLMTLIDLEGTVSVRAGEAPVRNNRKFTFTATAIPGSREIECNFRIQQVGESALRTDLEKVIRLDPGKYYYYIGTFPVDGPVAPGMPGFYSVLVHIVEIISPPAAEREGTDPRD